MHLLGVNQGMTTAFHSGTDGQAEKIIETGLCSFLRDAIMKYSKLVEYLSILEHEYSSLVHSSTDFTLNEL
jgi:hypothetical protein